MTSAQGPDIKRRGRPPSLTRERIVEAALKLADQAHLEKVSMRDLASELDVPVMTIYNYVGSKEELFGLVVDQVLSSVPLPPVESGSWIERIHTLERDARQALREHPGLSLSRHSGSGQEAMRLAEGVISILRDGGFEPEQAIMAFATLYTFMLGQIELDVLADTLGGEATFEGIAGEASVSRDQLFEIGFAAVIAGIKANLLEGGSSVPSDREFQAHPDQTPD